MHSGEREVRAWAGVGAGGAVAAGWVVPSPRSQRGVLVRGGARALSAAFQTDGMLGAWGWFEQISVPYLEVIGPSSNPCELRGYLRVIRTSTPTDGSAQGGPTGPGPRWG